MSRILAAVLTAACLVSPAAGGQLREAQAVDSKLIESAMLKAFQDADPDSLEGRKLAALEEDLRTTFTALPKNEHGRLGHSSVRYLLHRFFMQRYAWFVRGLEPGDDAGKAKVTSTDFSLAGAPVWPSFLQGDLEELSAGGLDLRGVASLAFAFEELAHQDSVNRLTMAYDGFGTTPEATLEKDEILTVLKEYMLLYTSGWNMTEMTHDELEMEERKHFHSQRWRRKYVPFLRDLQEELGEQMASKYETQFEAVTGIAEEVDRRFFGLNNQDCGQLKHTLLGMESRKPGRVRLSDFYNKSRESKWAFTEKIEYLRILGALDETNKSNPLVIVPNYITAMPQCLKASGLYTVCCPNECESVMGEIERVVGAPEAWPEAIADLVRGMATDTVEAPRELSETLVYRLREVASLNGGRVPIHGRLFHQWLHHAFPRECPFPHEASTTSPLTPDEWIRESGHSDSQASEAEMLQHIQADDTCPVTGCAPSGSEADSLPWFLQEKLLHEAAAEGEAGGAAIDSAESDVRMLLGDLDDDDSSSTRDVAGRRSVLASFIFTPTTLFLLLAVVIAAARWQQAEVKEDPKKAWLQKGGTGPCPTACALV